MDGAFTVCSPAVIIENIFNGWLVMGGFLPLYTAELLSKILTYFTGIETVVSKYKGGVTLSPVSGDIGVFLGRLTYSFSSKASRALTAQSIPPLHKRYRHTALFSARPNVKLYQCCQLLPAWPLFFLFFFFLLRRQPESVMTAPLLIFIF